MHDGPHLFHAQGVGIKPTTAILREGPITITWETGLGLACVSWRSQDVEVHCWQTDGLHIELSLGEHRPDLPAEYSVDRCWLGVFRIRASERSRLRGRSGSCALPQLCCSFDAGDGLCDGGPDAGEGLDAQTWDVGGRRLSIGTEDADFLCHRAREGSTLPSSWEHELSAFLDEPHDDYPVRYLDRGLALLLPPLPRGGYCELHLASAIGPAHREDDAATWYAVDVDPRRCGPPWAR